MHFLFSFKKSNQPNFYLRNPDSYVSKMYYKILIKMVSDVILSWIILRPAWRQVNEQKSHGPEKVLLTSGLTGKPIKVGHSNALKTTSGCYSFCENVVSIFRTNKCLFVDLSWRTNVNHGVLLGFGLLHWKAQRDLGRFPFNRAIYYACK